VDDYSLIAYEFGAEMARQQIRYAEVTFSPHTNVALTGLPFDEIMAGLNEGRARAQAELGVEFRWVLDIVRSDPTRATMWLAGRPAPWTVAWSALGWAARSRAIRQSRLPMLTP